MKAKVLTDFQIYVSAPLKNLWPGQFWGALTHADAMNFKTSCCNLKIEGLAAKLCVAFLLLWFWKELCLFKVKDTIHFVEQKYKL